MVGFYKQPQLNTKRRTDCIRIFQFVRMAKGTELISFLFFFFQHPSQEMVLVKKTKRKRKKHYDDVTDKIFLHFYYIKRDLSHINIIYKYYWFLLHRHLNGSCNMIFFMLIKPLKPRIRKIIYKHYCCLLNLDFYSKIIFIWFFTWFLGRKRSWPANMAKIYINDRLNKRVNLCIEKSKIE